MKFLGLRLCEHDSNLAYSDGTQVKYIKLERLKHIKHYGSNNLYDWLPVLKTWNINPKELDAICFVIDDKYQDVVGLDYSLQEQPINIINKIFSELSCPIYRIDHHWAHVLSMWPLAVETTTDFVFDGFGDDLRSHTILKNDEIVHFATLKEAESIGRMFGAVGKEIFNLKGQVLDHAGKLMGLKSYGNLNEEFSNSIAHLGMYDVRETFEPARWAYNRNLEDWLRCLHEHYEKVYPDYFLKFADSEESISYSGGIAQNTVINTKIKQKFNNIAIPPHCNDDGLSLGCIEYLRKHYEQPQFSNAGFPFWQEDEQPPNRPSDVTIQKVAEALAQGHIVGWYQGKGEIGPRALGNRSVLMNPTIQNGKDILNQKVKQREAYRPFGATILEERTTDYFDWSDPSPYMLFVCDILDKQSFKPITHVDNTCRIQTLDEYQNVDYRRLISSFEKLTGVPMLLNTSLNIGGNPIAGSFSEAFELFYESQLDILVIGDDIYYK